MILRTFLWVIICSVFFSANLFADEKKCEKIDVPIVFDQYGLPTIALIINGKSNFALLDLGSTAGVHLPISAISSFAGVKYTGASVKSTNISGQVFSSKAFIIPKLTIECLTFENITGYELNDWATSIGEKPDGLQDDQQVVIGQGFFNGKTIVINYASKKLTITNNKTDAKPAETSNRLTPYKLSEEGITIQMSSRFANYQMVLDTGASHSIFSASKINSKEPLSQCDFDLGKNVTCESFVSAVKILGYSFSSNLLLYPIDSRFKQDGLLGGDFFNKFIVTLNFSNKNIALIPSEPSALSIETL